MGWLSRTVDALTGRQLRAMIEPSDLPGLPPPSHWAGWPAGWRTSWGMDAGIDDNLFGNVSTVWAAVDLLARSISQMPMRVMKGGLDVAPRPAWADNPHPGSYASHHDFVESAMLSLLLRGNTLIYSLNEYQTGYPRQFIALDPDLIWGQLVDGEPQYRVGDEYGPVLERERICHIRYTAWPGMFWGLGPMDVLARSIGITNNLEHYAADVARSPVPWGVLSTDADITAQQANDMKQRWLEARADSSGAPAILSAGLELQTLSLTPEQMTLLGLSTMSERRIAAAFGIQPWLLGIPVETSGTITYSNISQMADTLWRMTLRPLAQNLSSALTQWALPVGSDVVFDSDEFTRPDPKTRAETAAIMYDRGIISADEWRVSEMMPPLGQESVMSGAGFIDTQQPGGRGATNGRQLAAAEVAQKAYLAVVNGVLTAEEARAMIRDAGADIDPNDTSNLTFKGAPI